MDDLRLAKEYLYRCAVVVAQTILFHSLGIDPIHTVDILGGIGDGDREKTTRKTSVENNEKSLLLSRFVVSEK